VGGENKTRTETSCCAGPLRPPAWVNTRNAVANGGNTRNRIDDRESDTAMSTNNDNNRGVTII